MRREGKEAKRARGGRGRAANEIGEGGTTGSRKKKEVGGRGKWVWGELLGCYS